MRCRLFDTMVASWLIDSEQGSYGMDGMALRFLELPHHPLRGGGGQGARAHPGRRARGRGHGLLGRGRRHHLPALRAFRPAGRFPGAGARVPRAGDAAGAASWRRWRWPAYAWTPGSWSATAWSWTRSWSAWKGRSSPWWATPSTCAPPASCRACSSRSWASQPLRKTKTGQSTDSFVLEELAGQGQKVPELVLAHRQLSKLKSTYVDALPAMVNPVSGRVHTNFLQTGAATGRLASKDPNSAEHPGARGGGAAHPHRLRARAGLGVPERRLRPDRAGHPGPPVRRPHAARGFRRRARTCTARPPRCCSGSAEKEVSAEQRRIGKTINFGVIYGMSAFRLARDMRIPRKEADELHQHLLPALRRGGPVPEGHRPRGRGERLRADPDGPPPPGARDRQPQPHGADGRGTGGGELPHPGQRCGHREEGHDRGDPACLRPAA